MKIQLKMKKNILALSLIALAVGSCNYNPKVSEKDTIQQGKITIAADESLQPIMQAQVQAYKAHYPKTEFNVVFLPEQEAINLMLKDSAQVCVTTRELNENERVYYTKNGFPYEPAPMALDAVALITNRSNADTTLTIEELKDLFTNPSSTTQLVFDNSNSSNLSFIKNRLGIKELNKKNIYAAKGNLDVFEHIKKYKSAIGIIGNNWISDDDDKEARKLKSSIRVLAIADKSKKGDASYYLPTLYNLQKRQYPLERLIYLHTPQSYWGLAKGFIRFSCAQVGQLVVEKMGLLPYHIMSKTYVLDTKTMKRKEQDEKDRKKISE